MRSHLLCASRVEEWRVGRVVFDKNAEPDKWFRLDCLLLDIAAHQPSIVPASPAIDPQDSASDSSGVVALSSQPDIFQSATEATASSQGGRMAACHEIAFIDPGVADFGVGDASDPAENLSISAAVAR
jgi:hypothetical protein